MASPAGGGLLSSSPPRPATMPLDRARSVRSAELPRLCFLNEAHLPAAYLPSPANARPASLPFGLLLGLPDAAGANTTRTTFFPPVSHAARLVLST